MSDYLFELKQIIKRFNGVTVLDKVNFAIRPGEIKGLVGNNGSGKTLLAKIISGADSSYSGSIFIEGSEVSISSPRDAQLFGIEAIYQESNLVSGLSVAENIFMGNMPTTGKWLRRVNWKTVYSKAKALLDEIDRDISPRDIVAKLPLGHQRIVEIAKAMSQSARLIVFDESYANISQKEFKMLAGVIRNLKRHGIAVIYISHRIEEVLELCDTVCLLHNGSVTMDEPVNKLNKQVLLERMSGILTEKSYPRIYLDAGRTILRAEEISTCRGLKAISFDLRKGEILGIVGMLGSGRTAVARALFGLDPLLTGNIRVNDVKIKLKSPEDAIRAGIGYVPDDRLNDLLFHNLDISQNITFSNIKRVTDTFKINLKAEREIAEDYQKKLIIQMPLGCDNVAALSGGNQQKLLLSKWIFSDSRIMILDEPTKGVDKSSRVEIYNLLNKYVMDGSSVIMISSDVREVMGMCDRIIVLCGGVIMKIFDRSEFSMKEILWYASGGLEGEKREEK